jgi:peptidoglycan/LPS O-acetylase OafA/YrhL
MGAFFGCRLWEFAAGMALAAVFAQQPAKVERLLFSWPLLAAGILVYGLGGLSYQPGFTYAFTDGLIATGLFIIVAQGSRLLERMAIIGPLLPLAGVYSFGIYLLHQPYVMYFGERLQGRPMIIFIFAAVGLITIIAALAMLIEVGINKGARKIVS